MDKVFTAKDIAKRDGCQSQREWTLKRSADMRRRNALDTPFTGRTKTSAEPAEAYIDFGRWLADCPVCGGAEYVDFDEKIFYCFGCGNFELGGDARPVKFPSAKERRKVEKDVMSRKVQKRKGVNKLQREMLAEPEDKPRNWKPEKREAK